MDIEIFIIVTFLALIQSIFGVGILLLGTPILLLLNMEFISVLYLLLPISLCVNLIQIVYDFKKINFKFYKEFLLFSIPLVVLSLLLTIKLSFNINLLVGIFIILIAIKNQSVFLNKYLNKLMKKEKYYFIIMGFIHGGTNLGGSLLTPLVYSKFSDKSTIRVTVALSYATFAFVQILTLTINQYNQFIFSKDIFYFCLLGIFIFVVTEFFLFKKISNNLYNTTFQFFLFIMGVVLFLKSI